MVLRCEFLFLFHSPLSLTLARFPPLQSLALASSPKFLFSPHFSFNYEDWGKWGEMTRLYLNGDSQSASCIIMRSDMSIHTKLFLSLCVFVLPEWGRITPSFPSLTIHFPHTSFFFKPQTSTQYLLFFLPSLLSTPEYPIIPSAAQWAVWMCLNSYVTSFSWVASCSSPLRNLPATLCQSMGSLSSAFLRHKYDPLMGMALSLVLKVRLTQVKPFHLAAQWPFT